MAAIEANESNMDRRATPRVELRVDVEIADGGETLSGVAIDVSTSGIFVATMRLLPIGSRVAMRFHLPQGLVFCDGVVRRARTASEGNIAGMGIEFDDLSDLDRALLEAACDDPTPRHSGVSHKKVT